MSPALDYSGIAHLYDSYVRFKDDIPFFLEECRKVQGPVLELMAGTGRVSLPLAEAGVELTCVDSSGPMLEVLRRRLAGRTVAEHALTVAFVLLEEAEVRALATSAGFRPEALFGGYDRSPYDPESSQFMIWSLRKAG